MNFPSFSSSLLRYCLATVLLLTLLVSGVQDLWAQDALENCDIVLTLDADTHSDDSPERDALLSRTPLSLSVSLDVSYPPELALAALPNCFPPPDRPPAISV